MADTPAITPELLDMWAKIQAGGAGASPSISTPATEPWILARTKEGDTPDPDAPQVPTPSGYSWYRNIGYTPPKPAAVTQPTMYGGKETGYYVIDPTAPNQVRMTIPPYTPNIDEEMDKAMTREQNEQLRRQRQINEQNGLGYADDETVHKRTIEMQKSGVDQEQVKARYAELAQRAKEFDRTQKVADDKATQDILASKATVGQTVATTARTGAETAQINQNVDIAGQKLPGELAQQDVTRLGTIANTAGTEAATANQRQATQIAGAPTVQAPPAGMSQWARDPKTGAITQGAMNPEWMPKTQAEVAARVGQIQQLANAKKAEVMGKVGANFTADQAYAEFNNWYDQQVGPQVDMLKAAQNAAQLEQAKAQQAMRTSAMTTAQSSGQQNLNAFQQLRESHPISDTTQNVMAQVASGKPLKDVDMRGAFTWEGPNPIDLAQQGTQNALKYIDPQSAQASGLPPPDFSGLDINSMLGRDRYMPGGAPPSAPPAPPALAATAAAGATGAPPAAPTMTNDWFAEWQKRQARDRWEQQQQALVPFIGAPAGVGE